jgi:hypothetical protein
MEETEYMPSMESIKIAKLTEKAKINIMKNKGKMHKGKMQHRLKQNPLEQKFALEWEKINSGIQRHGILDYLLAEDNNRPLNEVSDRDREVAATVIQWLGSPVGKNFLYRIIGETKNGKI